jgi:hypothetical protein
LGDGRRGCWLAICQLCRLVMRTAQADFIQTNRKSENWLSAGSVIGGDLSRLIKSIK